MTECKSMDWFLHDRDPCHERVQNNSGQINKLKQAMQIKLLLFENIHNIKSAFSIAKSALWNDNFQTKCK